MSIAPGIKARFSREFKVRAFVCIAPRFVREFINRAPRLRGSGNQSTLRAKSTALRVGIKELTVNPHLGTTPLGSAALPKGTRAPSHRAMLPVPLLIEVGIWPPKILEWHAPPAL